MLGPRAIGGLLLAAGSSSRMGRPKQLLVYQGETLIRRAAMSLLAAHCDPIWIALGSRADEIEPALHGLPVRILVNSRWASGMGSSLRMAATAAEAAGVGGLMVTLVDQPLVDHTDLTKLIRTFHTHQGSEQDLLIASAYAGTLGVPAIFSQRLLSQIQQIPPSSGCRELIASHPRTFAVPLAAAAADVDTREEFERLPGSFIPA